MHSRIIAFIFIIIFTYSAHSQNIVNTTTIDEETYTLWLAKDWDKLITIGKTALHHGVDFYYLRVRMGIAYFEKNNFHNAIHNFEKAYAVNSKESFLKEYLYYAYLYSGRQSEAEIIALSFSWEQKEKIKTSRNKFIDQLNITYNTNLFNNQSVIDDYSISADILEDGSQQISKSLNYFNLSLEHRINPKFSIFHGYSKINKTSFSYTIENGIGKNDHNDKTTLRQYYLSGKSRIARNLNILFGFHYLNIQYSIEDSTFRQGQFSNYTSIVTDNDFIGFMSAYKNFTLFTLGTSVYFAGLNNAKQLQGDFLLTLYPLGNMNLYSVSTLSFQSEKYSGNQPINQFVFDQQIGVKLAKKIWIEGYTSFGNMHNFIRNNGFVIYNGLDIITQRYGGQLIIPLKSTFKIKINYSFVTNESSYILSTQENTNYNIIRYNNHSITGGISWNF